MCNESLAMINTEALQLRAAFVFFSNDVVPSLTTHLIPRPVCLISSQNRPQVSANKCRLNRTQLPAQDYHQKKNNRKTFSQHRGQNASLQRRNVFLAAFKTVEFLKSRCKSVVLTKKRTRRLQTSTKQHFNGFFSGDSDLVSNTGDINLKIIFFQWSQPKAEQLQLAIKGQKNLLTLHLYINGIDQPHHLMVTSHVC